jgi:hypothetical protein
MQTFHFPFDECLHGKHLRTQINLSHLHPLVQPKVTALVKKYWSVFDEPGVWVPVWNYEWVIDTGAAHPIAIKKIQVQAQGASNHAEGHLGPEESRTHPPNA